MNMKRILYGLMCACVIGYTGKETFDVVYPIHKTEDYKVINPIVFEGGTLFISAVLTRRTYCSVNVYRLFYRDDVLVYNQVVNGLKPTSEGGLEGWRIPITIKVSLKAKELIPGEYRVESFLLSECGITKTLVSETTSYKLIIIPKKDEETPFRG
jgi:hypothetical protein